MAKTKTTPKKNCEFRCGFCIKKFSTRQERDDHLVTCETDRYYCDHCSYHAARIGNLQRHLKAKHKVEKSEQLRSAVNCSRNSDSEWEDQDPGTLIVESNEEDSCNNRESGSGSEGEEGELANKTLSDARPQTLSTTSEPLLQGRVVRKRTQPLPLDYRKRDETPPVRTGTMCADVGTQTETVLIKRLNDEGSQTTPVFFTRRQETTTEYIEGGKKIRIVEIKEAI